MRRFELRRLFLVGWLACLFLGAALAGRAQAAPPGSVTLTAPSGTGVSSTPTYTWDATTGTTNYRLWVNGPNNGPSGNVVDITYTAAQAGCDTDATCSVTPSQVLVAGTHNFFVQASNGDGDGPWSGPLSFTVGTPLSAPTPSSPTGSGVSTTPTYQWNAVSSATSYRLWVNRGSTNVIDSVLTSAQAACDADTLCEITPSTTLSAGNHRWWVRALNATNYSEWSTPTSFTAGSAPAQPTLVSPSGPGISTTPDFTWNSVSGATSYQLWVNEGSTTDVINHVVTPTCAASCTIASPATLAAGPHTWWVRAINAVGNGPWSQAKTFTVGGPPTATQPTTVSPTGTTSDTTPTYTWNPVSGATSYHLWVNAGSTRVVNQIVTPESECLTTCELTPSTTLTVGGHTWWVRARNASGAGPWSTATTFNSPNQAPTDISVSPSSLAENLPTATAVGSLASSDPNAADTFTYALVDTASFPDNASFQIGSSDQLKSAASFDFETKNLYSIRVRSTDAGGLTFDKTLSITITNVNDPPTAVNDAVATDEDTFVDIDVSANDTDPDTPNASLRAISVGSATGGTAVLQSGNRIVRFTPQANLNATTNPGGFSFTYQANDGSLNSTNTATVSITVNAVNDPPSFTAGADDTVDEDFGARTVNPWTTGFGPGGGSDEAGQTVSFNVTNNTNPGLFSSGPAVSSTGVLTYTPTADANGTATVTVAATDDGTPPATSGGQSFNITVTAVNDAPSNIVPGAQTGTEDTDLTFSSSSIQTGDVDVGTNPVKVTLTATNGTATLSGTTGLTFTDGTSNGQSVVAFTGTVANVNTALDGLKFRGTLHHNSSRGANSLQIVTNDQGNSGSGGALSDSDSVAITLAAVNDPPVAPTRSVTVQTNMKRNDVSGLLAGVTDPDSADPGFTPTFSLASVTASSCSGCTISDVQAAGTFDLDPGAGLTGSHSLQYTVSDNGSPGTATSEPATINVTLSGDRIWFVDDSATGGTGRMSEPFQTIAAVDAVDALGDRVFVHSGSYSHGITLHEHEALVGQGVSGASFDSVFNISPPAGTVARPSIGGTRPVIFNKVTFGGNNGVVRGLNLTPSSGTEGIAASGKSSLTTSEVSVTTTNAAAVNFVNSDGAFSFTAVSANGGTNGIVWDRTATATGSFTVTGNGGTCTSVATCTGGAIQSTTAIGATTGVVFGLGNGGVYFKNAKDVSLTNMIVQNNAGSGVYGTRVTNATITGLSVFTNGTNVNSDPSGIRFEDLFGTGTISSTTVSGSLEDNVHIENENGTLSNLTIQNSTIQDNNVTTGGSGIIMNAEGASGNITATIKNSTIRRNRARGVAAYASDSGTLNVTVRDSTFLRNFAHVDIAQASPNGVTYNVLNNNMSVDTDNNSIDVNIFLSGASSGTWQPLRGNIHGNTMTQNGHTGGGGIQVTPQGPTGGVLTAGSVIASIKNNTITTFDTDGISIIGQQKSTSNLTIQNNTVTITNAGAADRAIRVQSGAASGETTFVCAEISSNQTDAQVGAADDIRVRAPFDQGTFVLPGYTGTATDSTAIRNFVHDKQNNATFPNVVSVSVGLPAAGKGFQNGAACTLPPAPPA